MNLSQLQYFRKLAQLEHYTKAAAELYISQPSLSASVASLEKELGLKLFQKHGRNVKLTEEGKAFYQYVCKALDILEDGIAVTTGQTHGLVAKLEIATTPSLLLHYVPQLLLEFKRQQNKAVEVHLHNASSEEVLTAGLEAGRYDFVFYQGTLPKEQFFAVPVEPLSYAVLVPTSHPLADRSVISWEDLQQYQLVLCDNQNDVSKTIQLLLKQHNLPVAHRVSDEFALSGYLSQHEDHIAVVANAKLFCGADHLRCIPLWSTASNLTAVYLFYNKKRHISRTMEQFLNFIEKRES